MKKQRTNEYFEGFVSGMESACKAAEYLESIVEHYDPAKLDDVVIEMHKINRLVTPAIMVEEVDD